MEVQEIEVGSLVFGIKIVGIGSPPTCSNGIKIVVC